MSEKLMFFKAVVFAADNVQTPLNPSRQVEVLLPVDAISHLTANEAGNPRTSYKIHVKKNYPLNAPWDYKSIQPIGFLTGEQVELLK